MLLKEHCLNFARRAKKITNIALMLNGGFITVD
jgi:hypothetical protein